MNAPAAPRLPTRHGLGSAQVPPHVRTGRRALVLIARAGEQPRDRRERRRQRQAEEKAAREARRAERKRRAVENQKALDGAVRKPSTPGLAFTVAIASGVMAAAEARFR